MRRRRRYRPRLLTLLVGLAVAWWAVTAAARWTQQHPAAAGTAGLAAAALAGVALRLWIRRRRGRAVVNQRLASLGDRTGKAAEQLVADLLERDGCTRVKVCGGGGDLGADVTGRLPDGRRIVVQVKDYTRPIGSPALQTFNGTCWSVHRADRALFVTTSSFTPAAVAFARGQGIELVDRAGLAAWMAGTAAAA